MAVLDTNFLVDVEANDPGALSKARELEAAGRPRVVPRVVVSELWVAVGKGTQSASNRRRYDQLLDGLPRTELTEAIAKRAGEIEGAVQASDRNGNGVGVPDAIIAATAIERGEPVVTNDTDFRRRIREEGGISALQIESYGTEP